MTFNNYYRLNIYIYFLSLQDAWVHLHLHVTILIFRTHVFLFKIHDLTFACYTTAPAVINNKRAPSMSVVASLTPAREANLVRVRVALEICQKFLLGIERSCGGVPKRRSSRSHYCVT